MVFSKKIEFNDHTGPIYSISSASHFVYSSGADKWVARWNMVSQEQDKFAIKLQAAAYTIQHSSQLNLLYIGCSTGDFHIIDTLTKEEIKFIQHHKTAIFSITENTYKQQLYTGDSDGNLCVWSLTDFNLSLQLPLHCGKIRSIALIDQGEKIAVGSKDGTLRIFDTTFFNEVSTFNLNKTGIQSLLCINENLFIGDYDGYLYVFDPLKNDVLSKVPAHKGAIYSMVQFDANHFLTGSRDKSIKIWDLATFKVIQKIDLKSGGHKNSVNQLCLIQENQFISCSDDSKLICWKKED